MKSMNEVFDYFSNLFYKNNFSLYMIGSTSRDYLLGNDIKDYDFVTDATPEEISNFLKCDMSFSKYGVVKVKYFDKSIDIATLRKESNYKDSRHPSEIVFIKDINVDYLRRDFTINAIYIDKDYNIIDPSNGVVDLKNRVLRFIKDPLTSINEDPLRILRAYRFIKEYNLKTSEETLKILENNYHLVNKLNVQKVIEEERKAKKYE